MEEKMYSYKTVFSWWIYEDERIGKQGTKRKLIEKTGMKKLNRNDFV